MTKYARTSTTVYVPISKNVYFDGFSFRVRHARDRKKTSKSFPNRKDALLFRDTIMG